MAKQFRAKLKNLNIAPRKTRVVADVIRGMPIADAEAELVFRRERAAKPLLKLLKSAAANAKEQGLSPQTLVVKSIMVNKGIRLKRWLPRAQGRATPLHKDRSHVLLILEESTQKKGRFQFGVVSDSVKKDVKSAKSPAKKAPQKDDAKKSPKLPEEETAKAKIVEKPGFFRRVFRRKSI